MADNGPFWAEVPEPFSSPTGRGPLIKWPFGQSVQIDQPPPAPEAKITGKIVWEKITGKIDFEEEEKHGKIQHFRENGGNRFKLY